jgi:P-type conjugative transfer protein TrbG
MKRLLTVGILLLTGCAPQRPHPVLPAPVVDPTVTSTSSAASPPPPQTDAVLLPADAPELQQAMEQYQTTGTAPVIDRRKTTGFVQYPFGLSQPTVICQPLQLCDIELEPGEEVIDLAAGDQERWVLQPLRSGPPSKRTVHVMVKPVDDTRDMETAVVIGTTRRVYRIRLLSKRKGYIVNARFYYPQDIVRHLATTTHEAIAPAPSPSTGLMIALDQLDDRYTIDGETSWRPTWVANDGRHTYLRMPPDLHTTEAPALFVTSAHGQPTPVNYRVRGGYYIVDSLFERAVLTQGAGSDQQTVTITRTGR